MPRQFKKLFSIFLVCFLFGGATVMATSSLAFADDSNPSAVASKTAAVSNSQMTPPTEESSIEQKQMMNGDSEATMTKEEAVEAQANELHLHLDGKTLSIFFGIPFVGILLCIALGPQLFPSIWEHHYGKISAIWSLLFLVPAVLSFGPHVMTFMVVETLMREYIPFVLLLLSLFVVSGGIRLTGRLVGKPMFNIAFLAIGMILASVMGTTGASMLLIRPLIRANAHRRHKIHTIVFFIFIVANVGGSLTPLGDPPLFLGFLAGIDFLWTAEHMFLPWIVTGCLLLLVYAALEAYFFPKEPEEELIEREEEGVAIEGKRNFIFLLGIIGAVLLSGMWKIDAGITIYHVFVPLPELSRDVLLIAITLLSWLVTPHVIHHRNEYSWGPIIEVAKLFAGIFITIMPVLVSLKSGTDGALGGIVSFVSDPAGNPIDWRYFWLTGILSSFLDNAPTYLVFFNTASGDPHAMMHELTSTLLAISSGAVFFGAMSYIGNAPNFMVRSIAIERGVAMPSFFGYMAWSVCFLAPILILDTFIFWD